MLSSVTSILYPILGSDKSSMVSMDMGHQETNFNQETC